MSRVVLVAYDDDGRIIGQRSGERNSALATVGQLGSHWIEVTESSSPQTHYVDVKTKRLRKFGVQPSSAHTYDFKEHRWVDNRTEEQRRDDVINVVRQKRNKLLAATDWTQMPDSPLPLDTQMDYAVYRQALRDLTEGLTALSEADRVVFPTPPE